MIKYLKPLELFKEFLNGRDEWPSPVLVGLYVSDNYVSLALASDSYLIAHYYGLYPIGNLDDLVEKLRSLQSVDHKLRRIIVSSNNSVELDLDGKGIIGSSNNSVELDLDGKGIIGSSNNSVAPPVNIHTLIDRLCKKGNFESLEYTYLKDNLKSWGDDLSGRPQCRRPGNFEKSSAQRTLQVGLDFLNTLVDRKNVYEEGGFLMNGGGFCTIASS